MVHQDPKQTVLLVLLQKVLWVFYSHIRKRLAFEHHSLMWLVFSIPINSVLHIVRSGQVKGTNLLKVVNWQFYSVGTVYDVLNPEVVLSCKHKQ